MRDHFEWYLLVRFLIAIFMVWAGSTFPSMHNHDNIRLLALLTIVYNVGLAVLYRSTEDFRASLRLLAVLLDFTVVELVIAEYLRTPYSSAILFLPVVVYECWAYWEGPGVLGGMTATLIISLADWWMKQAVWHQTVSMAAMLYWAIFMAIIVGVPIGTALMREPEFRRLSQTAPQPSVKLTPREQEIYELVRSHKSLAQIARVLHIEPSTVKTHAQNICRKFGVSRVHELPLNDLDVES